MKESTFNREKTAAAVKSLLSSMQSATKKTDLFKELIPLLRKNLNADAVAIRIKDGDDYPYYTTIGFSDHFIETENYLCDGSSGSSGCNLQCLCGSVISGDLDAKSSFSTKKGSFWTNSTSPLSDSSALEGFGETRNVCSASGYESVALIPLSDKNIIHGLLQITHRQKGLFTRSLILFLEEIGGFIGQVITELGIREMARKDQEDKVVQELLKASESLLLKIESL